METEHHLSEYSFDEVDLKVRVKFERRSYNGLISYNLIQIISERLGDASYLQYCEHNGTSEKGLEGLLEPRVLEFLRAYHIKNTLGKNYLELERLLEKAVSQRKVYTNIEAEDNWKRMFSTEKPIISI